MNDDDLKVGLGTVFSDPDPDNARAFFKQRSCSMEDKTTTVKEVVAKMVNDGDYIAFGGFGTNRIPTAVIHEIIRQKKKNLSFAGHTSTHDFQLLVAGKCISKCDVAYILGLEARGLSPNARRAIQNGEIDLVEWTNAALSWRIKAAAMGIPFMPARNMFGTDTFKYSGAKEIRCPFTNKKLVALPALYPDFSAIHVHEADIYGNCRINGATVSDIDLAKASKRLVITTEKIISTDEIRSKPESTVIPFWCVDAVIEIPFGSYPGNMAGEYFSDEEYLKNWLNIEKDETAFKDFLDKQIYQTKDFYEYLEINGGIEKIVKLRAIEQMREVK